MMNVESTIIKNFLSTQLNVKLKLYVFLFIHNIKHFVFCDCFNTKLPEQKKKENANSELKS